MNIAIIPARAGSQRVTNKNIRPFNGKPIIAYSIEAALQSQLFDDVVVSTDSEKIANIAKQYGANVPWLRPKDIADHHTPTLPVIQHAINLYEAQNNVTIDTVCCVYAAAPFVTSELLSLQISSKEGEGGGFAVTHKCLTINNTRILKFVPIKRGE